jgi:hypothetical protein
MLGARSQELNAKSKHDYTLFIYSTKASLFFSVIPKHVDISVPSWHKYQNSVASEIGLLHLQPFNNGQLHVLITVESASFWVLLYQPKWIVVVWQHKSDIAKWGFQVAQSRRSQFNYRSDACKQRAVHGVALSCWSITPFNKSAVMATEATFGTLLVSQ